MLLVHSCFIIDDAFSVQLLYSGCSLSGIDLARQLDEGKDLAKTVAAIKDANKRGALHFAAREGKTEVCKYLLEELKLDVDSRDDDGILFYL